MKRFNLMEMNVRRWSIKRFTVCNFNENRHTGKGCDENKPQFVLLN